MEKGYVYLVGAGPGDPGLMTVKGKRCLSDADTVVYDALVNKRMLSWVNPDAKLIYVGKRSNHHTLKQPEINQVLIDEALQGKTVVRLKGGDPYVFGRGGEEAEALYNAGIAFEVVPGITSAVAVPSYAGIPVTHRTMTSSFTVVTGHEDPLKEDSRVNWPRLATDPGTLIFLMGVERLPKIVGQLTANGKDPKTPAALIQWGTRPQQKTAVGTLETIVEEVKRVGITSPAIIIVGQVVSMRQILNWFEKKPLFGKSILVTRAREQASVFSEMIERAGGEALEAPAISIEYNEHDPALIDAVHHAADYEWIVFTSVNGVEAFFRLMAKEGLDIRSMGKARICAIGPKTRDRLKARGLLVEALPEKFIAEGLIDLLKPLVHAGDRVLVPRSDLARKTLVEVLGQLGCDVNEVVAYHTCTSHELDQDILERLQAQNIDIITFTSSSTVRNLMAMVEDHALLDHVVFASIGPATSATLRSFGYEPQIEAKEYTINGLLEAIVDYCCKD